MHKVIILGFILFNPNNIKDDYLRKITTTIDVISSNLSKRFYKLGIKWAPDYKHHENGFIYIDVLNSNSIVITDLACWGYFPPRSRFVRHNQNLKWQLKLVDDDCYDNLYRCKIINPNVKRYKRINTPKYW